jgi:long-chain fatty acid transport protein
MLRRALARAWIAALLSVAVTAQASPEDIFGFGPRSGAMAGVGTASSDDYEAAYTNPALISRLRMKTLVVGYQGAAFDLHANGPGLPGAMQYDPATGILIGIGLPIPFGGALRDRLGLAIDFYTPTAILVRGRILYPETPQYLLLPDRTQSLAIRAGIGADLGYGVRVGGGFAALAQIEGSVVVATDSSGHVGSNVQDQLVAVYAPTFGATYDLPIRIAGERPLRLGLVFRGELEARFSVEIDATKLSSLNIPVLNIAGIAQYDPAEVAFEAAYDTKALLVAVGATYKKWSDYPGPLEPTISCTAMMPMCGALVPPIVPFHDTVVPRLGVERTLPLSERTKIRLRAGYAFEPTPSPSSTPSSQSYNPNAHALVSVPTRFFDASRNVFALGSGLEIPPFTLDAYGQIHVLVPRTITLTPGPDGAPSSTSSAEIGGTVLMAGMTLGVKF